MHRTEFIARLEQLLWDVPDSEREEALQYYNDYFADAGLENEADVIKELGTPEQVAAKIKAGFSEEAWEYSEQGYEDTRFRDAQEIVVDNGIIEDEFYDTAGNREQGQNYADKNTESRKTNNNNLWKILAIVLLCVLAAPIIIPIGAAILVAAFVVIVTIAALVFGLLVAGISIVIAGVAVVIAGLTRIFVLPAAGLLISGIGCMLFAIGLLVSLAICVCAVKVVPWIIQGIVGILRCFFRKAGVN